MASNDKLSVPGKAGTKKRQGGLHFENDKLPAIFGAYRARGLLRECLAEFLGTFILVVFGCGATAQWVLVGGNPKFGNWIIVALGWGLGLTFGLYVSAGVSGGHVNPAVTFALAIWRSFKWRKVIPFIFFQTLGGFAGAALVYGVWIDGFNAFDGGDRQVTGPKGTAGIFANYPQDFLTNRGGFIDQWIETTLFILCIFAVLDARNTNPSLPAKPLLIGIILFLIGISFGVLTGFAVNPARDFGPRCFAAIVYGSKAFTAHDWFWWIPIVGPLSGAITGGLMYDLFVKWHHPEVEESSPV